MSPKDEKVELERLIFTLSWEDPNLDRAAFGSTRGAQIATVGSGGCNALTFLLDDPARVFSFDYNPTQVFTLELKAAAFRCLDHAGVLELFGVRTSSRRDELLDAVLPELDPSARAFWATQAWVVRDGLLGGGRYERFVSLFGKLLRILQGRRRVHALFQERTRDERERFYAESWDTWRWRLLFKAFFSKTVLARRGLSADYFHFDDGSSSFAESFSRRTRHALVELPVRSNPYLARYVFGRYLDEEYLPEYLRPENHLILRERVDRLEIRVADVRDALHGFPDHSFDGICLSNVFELMSEEETARVLPRTARALRPGGVLTLRNLMIPRSADGVPGLVLDAERSRELHGADRSFVYRSFQIYTHIPLEESDA